MRMVRHHSAAKPKLPGMEFADDLHGFITHFGLMKRLTLADKDKFTAWFKWRFLSFLTEQGKKPNDMFNDKILAFIDFLYKNVGSFPAQVKFRRQIEALYINVIVP